MAGVGGTCTSGFGASDDTVGVVDVESGVGGGGDGVAAGSVSARMHGLGVEGRRAGRRGEMAMGVKEEQASGSVWAMKAETIFQTNIAAKVQR